jgi:hypothetical protein
VTIQYDIHHAAAHRHRSANLLRAPARRRLETKNESTWHIHWRYLCKKKKKNDVLATLFQSHGAAQTSESATTTESMKKSERRFTKNAEIRCLEW